MNMWWRYKWTQTRLYAVQHPRKNGTEAKEAKNMLDRGAVFAILGKAAQEVFGKSKCREAEDKQSFTKSYQVFSEKHFWLFTNSLRLYTLTLLLLLLS